MSTRRLAKSLLTRYVDPWNAPRVLFVLGAGTSLEAGLPLWNDPQLKHDIANRMVRAWGRKDAFLREAWASLAPDIGFQEPGVPLEIVIDRASTDQLCAVACRTALGRRALVQLLCERFPDRDHCPHPQLACELLAHLLKHRFADYVVTLNFDELLDASLDDELGEDGYAVVLSNHRERRRKEGIPWLFKLHGTISQQDSLRFTRDTTNVLTDWTVEALNEAIPAAEPLTVISLGYSWKDNDLAQWLRNRQNSISEIIVVAIDGTPARGLRRLLSKGSSRRTPVHAISTASIVSSGRPATVDEVLWACWKQIRADAPQNVSLPSAARHLLVSHLFPSPAPRQRWWPSIFAIHNCASRSEAELFLATAKANGMVTLSALARDPRVHRWLRQLRDDHKMGLNDARFLKSNEFRDVTEVFFFNGATEEDCLAFYQDRAGTRQSFSKARIQDPWNRRIKVPELSGSKLVRRQISYYRYFKRYLAKVLDSDEVEVDPGRPPRGTRVLLAGSHLLPTLGALYKATNVLLEREWATLLVIAESGRWLSKALTSSRMVAGRSVFLIETSTYGLEGWSIRPSVTFPPLAGLHRVAMPWWEHNRHLTLAVSEDSRLLGGIYFRRRQKTPRISPVEVSQSSQSDLRELLATFVSYTARINEMPENWRQGSGSDVGPFIASLLDVLPLSTLLSGRQGASQLIARLNSLQR